MPHRPTHLLLSLAIVLLAATSHAQTATPAAPPPEPSASETGLICIAPFDIEEPTPERPFGSADLGPLMSSTPAPSARSTFTFRVDRRLTASVRNREMGMITGVPLDRKVKVEVRLDEKPFETFWLDLGTDSDHRICLWLYPGYWHWIDQGWTASRGCKCDEAPLPVDPEPCPPEGTTCS